MKDESRNRKIWQHFKKYESLGLKDVSVGWSVVNSTSVARFVSLFASSLSVGITHSPLIFLSVEGETRIFILSVPVHFLMSHEAAWVTKQVWNTKDTIRRTQAFGFDEGKQSKYIPTEGEFITLDVITSGVITSSRQGVKEVIVWALHFYCCCVVWDVGLRESNSREKTISMKETTAIESATFQTRNSCFCITWEIR